MLITCYATVVILLMSGRVTALPQEEVVATVFFCRARGSSVYIFLH